YLSVPPPTTPTLFPYTTLFRSSGEQAIAGQAELNEVRQLGFRQAAWLVLAVEAVVDQQAVDVLDFLYGQFPAFEMGDFVARGEADRKSTRLNSSHVKSSYAVFC